MGRYKPALYSLSPWKQDSMFIPHHRFIWVKSVKNSMFLYIGSIIQKHNYWKCFSMLLFQKYTLFGSFSIKCILFHQIWPPYFLRYDQFTYTSENRNLGTFQHFSSNPGSGVEFVAISLLWNHPWFYCSWHQGHQKKSGCLFQNPITFSIEGVFQNGRLYGHKNIRMIE